MRNGKQDERNEIAIEYVIHKQLLICCLIFYTTTELLNTLCIIHRNLINLHAVELD